MQSRDQLTGFEKGHSLTAYALYSTFLVLIIAFYLMVFSRLLAMVLVKLINSCVLRGKTHLQARSVSLSLLGGKFVLSHVRYTTTSVSVLLTRLEVRCRYWRRIVHTPYSSGSHPHRVTIQLHGVEVLVYSNAARYKHLEQVIARRKKEEAQEEAKHRRIMGRIAQLTKRMTGRHKKRQEDPADESDGTLPDEQKDETVEQTDAQGGADDLLVEEGDNDPLVEAIAAAVPRFFRLCPSVELKVERSCVKIGSSKIPTVVILSVRTLHGTHMATNRQEYPREDPYRVETDLSLNNVKLLCDENPTAVDSVELQARHQRLVQEDLLERARNSFVEFFKKMDWRFLDDTDEQEDHTSATQKRPVFPNQRMRSGLFDRRRTRRLARVSEENGAEDDRGPTRESRRRGGRGKRASENADDVDEELRVQIAAENDDSRTSPQEETRATPTTSPNTPDGRPGEERDKGTAQRPYAKYSPFREAADGDTPKDNTLRKAQMEVLRIDGTLRVKIDYDQPGVCVDTKTPLPKMMVGLTATAPCCLTYSPWTDHQRELLLSILYPFDWEDSRPYRAKAKKIRATHTLELSVDFAQGIEARVPFCSQTRWCQLSLHTPESAQIHCAIPWALVTSADLKHHATVKMDKVTVDCLLPSRHKGQFLTVESFSIAADVHYPLRWNEKQLWDFTFRFAKASLWLTRELIDAISCLLTEWGGDRPDSGWVCFIPAVYTLTYDFHDAELILPAAKHNVLNYPLALRDTLCIILHTRALNIQTSQAFLVYISEVATMDFRINCDTAAAAVSFPSGHPLGLDSEARTGPGRQPPLPAYPRAINHVGYDVDVGSPSAGGRYWTSPEVDGRGLGVALQWEGLACGGRYSGFYNLNPSYRDHLTLNIDASSVTLSCEGHVLHTLQWLADNMGGPYVLSCTTSQYDHDARENWLARHHEVTRFRDGDTVIPINDFEVFLEVDCQDVSFLLPSSLSTDILSAPSPVNRSSTRDFVVTSVCDPLVVTSPGVRVVMRGTNAFVDVVVEMDDIHMDLEGDGEGVCVQGLRFHNHAIFSPLPDLVPCFCSLSPSIGRLSGRISPAHIGRLVHSARCVSHQWNVAELAVPGQRACCDPESPLSSLPPSPTDSPTGHHHHVRFASTILSTTQDDGTDEAASDNDDEGRRTISAPPAVLKKEMISHASTRKSQRSSVSSNKTGLSESVLERIDTRAAAESPMPMEERPWRRRLPPEIARMKGTVVKAREGQRLHLAVNVVDVRLGAVRVAVPLNGHVTVASIPYGLHLCKDTRFCNLFHQHIRGQVPMVRIVTYRSVTATTGRPAHQSALREIVCDTLMDVRGGGVILSGKRNPHGLTKDVQDAYLSEQGRHALTATACVHPTSQHDWPLDLPHHQHGTATSDLPHISTVYFDRQDEQWDADNATEERPVSVMSLKGVFDSLPGTIGDPAEMVCESSGRRRRQRQMVRATVSSPERVQDIDQGQPDKAATATVPLSIPIPQRRTMSDLFSRDSSSVVLLPPPTAQQQSRRTSLGEFVARRSPPTEEASPISLSDIELEGSASGAGRRDTYGSYESLQTPPSFALDAQQSKSRSWHSVGEELNDSKSGTHTHTKGEAEDDSFMDDDLSSFVSCEEENATCAPSDHHPPTRAAAATTRSVHFKRSSRSSIGHQQNAKTLVSQPSLEVRRGDARQWRTEIPARAPTALSVPSESDDEADREGRWAHRGSLLQSPQRQREYFDKMNEGQRMAVEAIRRQDDGCDERAACAKVCGARIVLRSADECAGEGVGVPYPVKPPGRRRPSKVQQRSAESRCHFVPYSSLKGPFQRAINEPTPLTGGPFTVTHVSLQTTTAKQDNRQVEGVLVRISHHGMSHLVDLMASSTTSWSTTPSRTYLALFDTFEFAAFAPPPAPPLPPQRRRKSQGGIEGESASVTTQADVWSIGGPSVSLVVEMEGSRGTAGIEEDRGDEPEAGEEDGTMYGEHTPKEGQGGIFAAPQSADRAASRIEMKTLHLCIRSSATHLAPPSLHAAFCDIDAIHWHIYRKTIDNSERPAFSQELVRAVSERAAGPRVAEGGQRDGYGGVRFDVVGGRFRLHMPVGTEGGVMEMEVGDVVMRVTDGVAPLAVDTCAVAIQALGADIREVRQRTTSHVNDGWTQLLSEIFTADALRSFGRPDGTSLDYVAQHASMCACVRAGRRLINAHLIGLVERHRIVTRHQLIRSTYDAWMTPLLDFMKQPSSTQPTTLGNPSQPPPAALNAPWDLRIALTSTAEVRYERKMPTPTTETRHTAAPAASMSVPVSPALPARTLDDGAPIVAVRAGSVEEAGGQKAKGAERRRSSIATLSPQTPPNPSLAIAPPVAAPATVLVSRLALTTTSLILQLPAAAVAPAPAPAAGGEGEGNSEGADVSSVCASLSVSSVHCVVEPGVLQLAGTLSSIVESIQAATASLTPALEPAAAHADISPITRTTTSALRGDRRHSPSYPHRLMLSKTEVPRPKQRPRHASLTSLTLSSPRRDSLVSIDPKLMLMTDAASPKAGEKAMAPAAAKDKGASEVVKERLSRPWTLTAVVRQYGFAMCSSLADEGKAGNGDDETVMLRITTANNSATGDASEAVRYTLISSTATSCDKAGHHLSIQNALAGFGSFCVSIERLDGHCLVPSAACTSATKNGSKSAACTSATKNGSKYGACTGLSVDGLLAQLPLYLITPAFAKGIRAFVDAWGGAAKAIEADEGDQEAGHDEAEADGAFPVLQEGTFGNPLALQHVMRATDSRIVYYPSPAIGLSYGIAAVSLGLEVTGLSSAAPVSSLLGASTDSLKGGRAQVVVVVNAGISTHSLTFMERSQGAITRRGHSLPAVDAAGSFAFKAWRESASIRSQQSLGSSADLSPFQRVEAQSEQSGPSHRGSSASSISPSPSPSPSAPRSSGDMVLKATLTVAQINVSIGLEEMRHLLVIANQLSVSVVPAVISASSESIQHVPPPPPKAADASLSTVVQRLRVAIDLTFQGVALRVSATTGSMRFQTSATRFSVRKEAPSSSHQHHDSSMASDKEGSAAPRSASAPTEDNDDEPAGGDADEGTVEGLMLASCQPQHVADLLISTKHVLLAVTRRIEMQEVRSPVHPLHAIKRSVSVPQLPDMSDEPADGNQDHKCTGGGSPKTATVEGRHGQQMADKEASALEITAEVTTQIEASRRNARLEVKQPRVVAHPGCHDTLMNVAIEYYEVARPFLIDAETRRADTHEEDIAAEAVALPPLPVGKRSRSTHLETLKKIDEGLQQSLEALFHQHRGTAQASRDRERAEEREATRGEGVGRRSFAFEVSVQHLEAYSPTLQGLASFFTTRMETTVTLNRPEGDRVEVGARSMVHDLKGCVSCALVVDPLASLGLFHRNEFWRSPQAHEGSLGVSVCDMAFNAGLSLAEHTSSDQDDTTPATPISSSGGLAPRSVVVSVSGHFGMESTDVYVDSKAIRATRTFCAAWMPGSRGHVGRERGQRRLRALRRVRRAQSMAAELVPSPPSFSATPSQTSWPSSRTRTDIFASYGAGEASPTTFHFDVSAKVSKVTAHTHGAAPAPAQHPAALVRPLKSPTAPSTPTAPLALEPIPLPDVDCRLLCTGGGDDTPTLLYVHLPPFFLSLSAAWVQSLVNVARTIKRRAGVEGGGGGSPMAAGGGGVGERGDQQMATVMGMDDLRRSVSVGESLGRRPVFLQLSANTITVSVTVPITPSDILVVTHLEEGFNLTQSWGMHQLSSPQDDDDDDQPDRDTCHRQQAEGGGRRGEGLEVPLHINFVHLPACEAYITFSSAAPSRVFSLDVKGLNIQHSAAVGLRNDADLPLVTVHHFQRELRVQYNNRYMDRLAALIMALHKLTAEFEIHQETSLSPPHSPATTHTLDEIEAGAEGVVAGASSSLMVHSTVHYMRVVGDMRHPASVGSEMTFTVQPLELSIVEPGRMESGLRMDALTIAVRASNLRWHSEPLLRGGGGVGVLLIEGSVRHVARDKVTKSTTAAPQGEEEGEDGGEASGSSDDDRGGCREGETEYRAAHSWRAEVTPVELELTYDRKPLIEFWGQQLGLECADTEVTADGDSQFSTTGYGRLFVQCTPSSPTAADACADGDNEQPCEEAVIRAGQSQLVARELTVKVCPAAVRSLTAVASVLADSCRAQWESAQRRLSPPLSAGAQAAAEFGSLAQRHLQPPPAPFASPTVSPGAAAAAAAPLLPVPSPSAVVDLLEGRAHGSITVRMEHVHLYLFSETLTDRSALHICLPEGEIGFNASPLTDTTPQYVHLTGAAAAAAGDTASALPERLPPQTRSLALAFEPIHLHKDPAPARGGALPPPNVQIIVIPHMMTHLRTLELFDIVNTKETASPPAASASSRQPGAVSQSPAMSPSSWSCVRADELGVSATVHYSFRSDFRHPIEVSPNVAHYTFVRTVIDAFTLAVAGANPERGMQRRQQDTATQGGGSVLPVVGSPGLQLSSSTTSALSPSSSAVDVGRLSRLLTLKLCLHSREFERHEFVLEPQLHRLEGWTPSLEWVLKSLQLDRDFLPSNAHTNLSDPLEQVLVAILRFLASSRRSLT
ncbi:unnamed protein product [Vitrella brassicaformis CCMP3155]|uniref:Fragile site-associated protein C-terminal domain-containing protein n=3 Tax=Vitrella brassicaformis TaxID=1169539 RepID=A0A0G4H3P6_VITBC|nr:unnamed protein product [Vitrella brassicaformis CCMP3155]|eukprot:CEM38351.1 unnamed protein product [Vitrella brassicaformis CCMP3155]